MKLKKREQQSIDTQVLLRRENKIPTGGDTETICGTEPEGKTIQRAVPHRDPSHIQLQNPDIVVDANKCLLTGT